jgi:hypothetical protein
MRSQIAPTPPASRHRSQIINRKFRRHAFRLAILVSAQDARINAHFVSRDQYQARLRAEDCLHWSDILHLGACDLGEVMFDSSSRSIQMIRANKNNEEKPV